MRIDERIADRHDSLTPQERRAAATLLENLDDLATYRAAELADLAGVSRATMSRLFRSLGFEDFDEVREHLRSLRGAGEPRRIDGAPNAEALAAAEQSAILRAIEHPRIPEAAGLLAMAGRVLVVGWRNSYPVALHLREQLVQARDHVTAGPVPGQTTGEELVGLGAEDVVVAVGFRRRPKGFGDFLAEAGTTGASVILIGDPTAVAHASAASMWLECPLQHSLAFDSYAAPMALASVLADAVLGACGRPGSRRVRAITETYERMEEVE
ncbi:MurR/RpiR family transcriptional regulator [Nocardioides sp. MH1]|uniref:MurR/RpiR family transcriptional regulator n=1 Tax=Nocardioides sp. MH1 TaxID=3242490 RepID=UPI003522E177